jgi:transcriptional regulator with XRE-family HTH domain
MKSFADLIREWMLGGPNRTAASLARSTGVPKCTISLILSADREPRIEVAARLAKVLPRDEVILTLIKSKPELSNLWTA